MHKKFRIYFLTLIFFAVLLINPQQSSAQLKEFLLLEKPGTKKRIRYYKGDEVTFMLKDQKQFFTKQIVALSDTSFFVTPNTEVLLDDVEALADHTKGKKGTKIGIGALYAIPAFFLFSGANNLFNTGDTPVIDQQVYPLSAIFASLGLAGILYNGRRYRLSNRWRIIVVRH